MGRWLAVLLSAAWGTWACGSDVFTSTSTAEALPDGAGLREDAAGLVDAAGLSDSDSGDGPDRAIRDASSPEPVDTHESGVPDASLDASVVEPDAGTLEDGGGPDVVQLDAGEQPDVALLEDACTPLTWYPDRDGDGHGANDGAQLACDAPGADWVSNSGDCDDDHGEVHPSQTAYFASGYALGTGELSFDYDCDGTETGDPTQLGPAPACSGLAIANCSGRGFVAGSRSGPGVNAWCGSRALLQCLPELLACSAQTTLIERGYACR